jgi:hypothetical protein
MVVKSMFIGFTAAFVVPLFLSLARSSLISDILSRKAADGTPDLSDMLILAGFCIVAALSARTFMQGVSRQVMNIARETREQVAYVNQKVISTEQGLRAEIEETKAATDTLSEVVENPPDSEADLEEAEFEKSIQELIARSEDIGSGPVGQSVPTGSGENAPSTETVFERNEPELSFGERAVLRALWAQRKRRRLPSSLARETGLSRQAVGQILRHLTNLGLVEQLPHSRTGQPVYRLSSSGGVRTYVMFGKFPPQDSSPFG